MSRQQDKRDAERLAKMMEAGRRLAAAQLKALQPAKPEEKKPNE
jgi:hypothetical protein